mgnify:CR=1 FL=1
MQKTKHFNKDIYETENKIKTALIILVMFLAGMYIGLAINYMELQNKEQEIREYQVEIDSKNQAIDTLNEDKNKLKIILNNYTIQERKDEK